MAISLSNDLPIYLCQNLICRLCGCTGNSNSYLHLDENHYLTELVKKETKVQIKNNDPLPKTVCRMCIEKVQLLEHFKTHCMKTQKVLYGMFSSKEMYMPEFENDQSEMIEDWLEEDYDDIRKKKQDQTYEIVNDKSYGVLYTDVKTFMNYRVSINENPQKATASVVPKILGRKKRQRVKIVNKEPNKKETTNNMNENIDKNAIDHNFFSDTMYVQISENDMSPPKLFRIITDQNQTGNNITLVQANESHISDMMQNNNS